MWPFGKKSESRFGQYFVTRLMHKGEKSLVFEATTMTSDEPVVIKAYTKAYDRAAAQLERKYDLLSEAQVGMMLNPGTWDKSKEMPIVATLGEGREYGKRSGPRYIVLEFVQGVCLKRLISCNDPALQQNVGSYVFQLCRALREVHRRDLVFRDFCSDNVVVGKGGKLKVIDLGFVAPAGKAFEERTGTASYMSPEQVQGKPLGFESDVYAVGVVIYEMLMAELPFVSKIEGDDEASAARRRLDVMRMHVEVPPPELPKRVRERTRVLSDVVIRCLAKKPQDRFRTIDELMAALV